MSATSPALPVKHKAHTNTGLSNGLIGVMCFLTSEMALFGSLIFMYLYTRRAAPLCGRREDSRILAGNCPPSIR